MTPALFEREVGKFLSSDFKEKFEIFFFDPPFASKDFLENKKAFFKRPFCLLAFIFSLKINFNTKIKVSWSS